MFNRLCIWFNEQFLSVQYISHLLSRWILLSQPLPPTKKGNKDEESIHFFIFFFKGDDYSALCFFLRERKEGRDGCDTFSSFGKEYVSWANWRPSQRIKITCNILDASGSRIQPKVPFLFVNIMGGGETSLVNRCLARMQKELRPCCCWADEILIRIFSRGWPVSVLGKYSSFVYHHHFGWKVFTSWERRRWRVRPKCDTVKWNFLKTFPLSIRVSFVWKYQMSMFPWYLIHSKTNMAS